MSKMSPCRLLGGSGRLAFTGVTTSKKTPPVLLRPRPPADMGATTSGHGQ